MGLRSEKAMSAHLLLENAHESNPVPDISGVDYLAGKLGCMHLCTLPRLPMFIDDVYLHREDCVVRGGHLSCTTGEGGDTKNIVMRIATAMHGSIGEGHDHIQTNIVNTLADQENTKDSAIRDTVARIEFNTKKKAQMQWLELYPGAKPASLFMAKVDISEIPMDELQVSLPAFERQLLAHSYDLYSTDYMQDFSGVLDREALVDHLCAFKGFHEQGDLPAAMRKGMPMILVNTDSVGRDMSPIGEHSVSRTKFCSGEYVQRKVTYNNILSAKITLTSIFFLFLPGSCHRKLAGLGGLDYTASHKIWVSLISVTKWQETRVNKYH